MKYNYDQIGNERWLDEILTTSRSSPVTVPSDLQEKLDRHSSIEYSSITFDESSDVYDASYGQESLPAICEYGKICKVQSYKAKA